MSSLLSFDVPPSRTELYHAAGGRCHWCGCMTLLTDEPVGLQATKDHVIPRCRGGADTRQNIVLACRKCNQDRNFADMQKPGHPGYVAPAAKTKKKGVSEVESLRAQLVLIRASRDQAIATLRRERSERDSEPLFRIILRRAYRALQVIGRQAAIPADVEVEG